MATPMFVMVLLISTGVGEQACDSSVAVFGVLNRWYFLRSVRRNCRLHYGEARPVTGTRALHELTQYRCFTLFESPIR